MELVKEYLRTIAIVIFIIIRKVVRSWLYFDKQVIKRYIGVETPLYKIWWKNNVRLTQRRLNRDYDSRKLTHYRFKGF